MDHSVWAQHGSLGAPDWWEIGCVLAPPNSLVELARPWILTIPELALGACYHHSSRRYQGLKAGLPAIFRSCRPIPIGSIGMGRLDSEVDPGQGSLPIESLRMRALPVILGVYLNCKVAVRFKGQKHTKVKIATPSLVPCQLLHCTCRTPPPFQPQASPHCPSID